jgi:hypothetical protein
LLLPGQQVQRVFLDRSVSPTRSRPVGSQAVLFSVLGPQFRPFSKQFIEAALFNHNSSWHAIPHIRPTPVIGLFGASHIPDQVEESA